MEEIKIHKISKAQLLKLNEKDLMFITNPGRMGDEDGITFIIKHSNEFTIYRVDGLMYPRNREKVDILLDDIIRQFPKWYDTWKHDNKEKYKYLYMGFGNGLSIDNSVYNEFEHYLNYLVEKYLEGSSDYERKSIKYAAIFNVWQSAFINMINDKKYLLK